MMLVPIEAVVIGVGVCMIGLGGPPKEIEEGLKKDVAVLGVTVFVAAVVEGQGDMFSSLYVYVVENGTGDEAVVNEGLFAGCSVGEDMMFA